VYNNNNLFHAPSTYHDDNIVHIKLSTRNARKKGIKTNKQKLVLYVMLLIESIYKNVMTYASHNVFSFILGMCGMDF